MIIIKERTISEGKNVAEKPCAKGAPTNAQIKGLVFAWCGGEDDS
jgi:hypothetical protein